MAIGTAGGGFDGNFSPIIYSKQAQIALRRSAVTNAITNNSYFGEIANQGDTVRIQKEPDVTVNSLQRHTGISVEKLDDSDFSLTIDKDNYFAFKMDDIEEQFANVDFTSLAADRAAYKMADAMDADVLSYLSGHTAAGAYITTTSGDSQGTAGLTGELFTANHLDATDFGNLTISGSATAGDSVQLAPRLPGATALSATTVSPLTVLARMARKMDTQNVDARGRWVVLDPVFVEMLKDEDSRMLNGDFGGSGLQNGLVLNNIHGFRVYVSNSLPVKDTAGGAGKSGTTAQQEDYGVIVAGQDDAVASAEQINKVENYRDPDSFADIVRGMHLYGRKILRPEALITARYNAA